MITLPMTPPADAGTMREVKDFILDQYRAATAPPPPPVHQG